jgi:hypothetical protein
MWQRSTARHGSVRQQWQNPGIATAPAIPGEMLTFYGIGFGPFTQGNVAGQIASGQTSVANRFNMTIGGAQAAVSYAGLAPGLVGVYQFNVAVPSNLRPGELSVQIALNGSSINLQTLFLPVGSGSPTGSFTLISSADVNDGSMPADYTCDGTGSTLRSRGRILPPARKNSRS